MAIRCTDENDESTYKVTGIYWGGMSSTEPSWYFIPHFSPFALNFGKNLSGIQSNIITAFKNSAAFTDNSKTDHKMYEQTA